ncbi:MAG: hypothetical protein EOP84_13160 [Verrucomicrobiaceae bacterium]|nr:MAG: hypothetical protein EOP84_13160 [Verrucomicrobiaceae bacterium]
MSTHYKETKYGFEFGDLVIERIASNDGSDKRKKWVAIQVKHPNGEVLNIIGTKDGITVQDMQKVRRYIRGGQT